MQEQLLEDIFNINIMNEELNLVEILKNVPEGTKFWSDVHGEVKYIKLQRFDGSEILCKSIRSNCSFSSKGEFYKGLGQCVLFPSKDQRDWSKFVVEEVFEKDEPVMCSKDTKNWELRYCSGEKRYVFINGCKSVDNDYQQSYNFMVKVSDFDFVNGCKKTK